MKDKIKRRSRRISGGIQTGVSILHLLIVFGIVISSIFFILVFGSTIKEWDEDSSEEQAGSEEEKDIVDVIDEIAYAIIAALLMVAIILLILGALFLFLFSMITVGNIRSIRCKHRISPFIGGYLGAISYACILTILIVLNCRLFLDKNTTFYLNLIIIIETIFMALSALHIFILHLSNSVVEIKG